MCVKWPIRMSGRSWRSMPRHERQVVVLHHDARCRRRLLGERDGEGFVVRHVRRPLATEAGVEVGRQRGVVQQVMNEPQRRVGDSVVRALERQRVDLEHPDGEPLGVMPGGVEPTVRRLARGLPVVVRHRGADPQRCRVADGRGQPGHQAAAAALRCQGSVFARLERHRAAIARDEHLSCHVARPGCCRWARSGRGARSR